MLSVISCENERVGKKRETECVRRRRSHNWLSNIIHGRLSMPPLPRVSLGITFSNNPITMAFCPSGTTRRAGSSVPFTRLQKEQMRQPQR